MKAELTAADYQRYNRQIRLEEFGPEGQLQIKNSSVFIIGAGGLGCPVLLYLAAAGIGKIGIADFDRVDLSNLHRQVLYSTHDVGQYKTEVLQVYMQCHFPDVGFFPFHHKIDPENILDLIKDYDVVIDGSDNYLTKYLVNDACVMLNKPLIFGSIYKFEGQIAVFNYKNGPTYRCLYPEMGELDNCSEIGVLGTLPGIVGSIMANETIKVLTGIGETLSGKLLVFDSLYFKFSSFSIALDEDNKRISTLTSDFADCQYQEGDITFAELNEKLNKSTDHVLLIDVRGEHEHNHFNIGGLNIPLAMLENSFSDVADQFRFKNAGSIVVYCKSGFRSSKASAILKQHQIQNVFSLKGGLDLVENTIDNS